MPFMPGSKFKELSKALSQKRQARAASQNKQVQASRKQAGKLASRLKPLPIDRLKGGLKKLPAPKRVAAVRRGKRRLD